jgi:hypothetical protein
MAVGIEVGKDLIGIRLIPGPHRLALEEKRNRRIEVGNSLRALAHCNPPWHAQMGIAPKDPIDLVTVI